MALVCSPVTVSYLYFRYRWWFLKNASKDVIHVGLAYILNDGVTYFYFFTLYLDETEFTIKGDICHHPKTYQFQNYGEGFKTFYVDFKVSPKGKK